MRQHEVSSDELATLKKQLREAVKEDLGNDPLLHVWLSDQTLERYIVARKYKLKDAVAMLKETIEWRKEHKPEMITYEEVHEEGDTGKMFITEYKDLHGRPAVIMRPHESSSKADYKLAVNYFIYLMERSAYVADHSGSDGKITWVIDLEDFAKERAAPLKTSYQMVKILQNHYPERLGVALIRNPSKFWSVLYGLLKPLMDPVSVTKVCMMPADQSDQLMAERFNVNELEPALGGKNAANAFHLERNKDVMLDLEERLWIEVLDKARELGVQVNLPVGRRARRNYESDKMLEKGNVVTVSASAAQ